MVGFKFEAQQGESFGECWEDFVAEVSPHNLPASVYQHIFGRIINAYMGFSNGYVRLE